MGAAYLTVGADRFGLTGYIGPMADLVTLGELLVDFIACEPGVEAGEAKTWSAAPGGAPANVAVGAARLGVSTAFLGKVGDDPFGLMLARSLSAEGVDTRSLLFERAARTALAFVSLTEDGERSFHFYRHPSADMLYRPEEVDLAAVRAARILHFGSLGLTGEPSRSATLEALAAAKEADLLITFDPNLRLDLWASPEEARHWILEAIRHAHVVKLSAEELEFLGGTSDIEAGRELAPELDLLVVTRGPAGADYLSRADSGTAEGTAEGTVEGTVEGFATKAIDTTGAGDSFMAALLAGIAADPTLLRRPGALRTTLRRANACAALTVAGRGAIPSLPTLEHLESFLAQHPANE